MERIDERLPVGAYISATIRTVDGIAWVLTCVVSLLCLIDVGLGFNLIPLRDAAKPGEAVVLLVFSPLLVFSILVVLRQLPFSGYLMAAWIRAFLCIAAFLILNF